MGSSAPGCHLPNGDLPPTWMALEMGRARAEWPERAGWQQEAVSAVRAGWAQQGGGRVAGAGVLCCPLSSSSAHPRKAPEALS